MAVSIGRLRPCPVFDYRFVGLSHNAVRGAAGGGILIAELLVKQQYVRGKDQGQLHKSTFWQPRSGSPTETALHNHVALPLRGSDYQRC